MRTIRESSNKQQQQMTRVKTHGFLSLLSTSSTTRSFLLGLLRSEHNGRWRFILRWLDGRMAVWKKSSKAIFAVRVQFEKDFFLFLSPSGHALTRDGMDGWRGAQICRNWHHVTTTTTTKKKTKTDHDDDDDAFEFLKHEQQQFLRRLLALALPRGSHDLCNIARSFLRSLHGFDVPRGRVKRSRAEEKRFIPRYFRLWIFYLYTRGGGKR